MAHLDLRRLPAEPIGTGPRDANHAPPREYVDTDPPGTDGSYSPIRIASSARWAGVNTRRQGESIKAL